MWDRPWRMKEGFLIGEGLLVVGLLLQATVGPIDWDRFAAPVNYGMLVLLLALIGVMYLLRRKVYAFEWMMHYSAAIPCLCYAVGLTILMGLTPQLKRGGIPWLSQMLQFWPFVLIRTWMMVTAGLATLNHLMRWKWREIPFLVNHLGIFLMLAGAVWLLGLKYVSKRWWVLLVALLLTAFFTFLTVSRMGPSAKNLMPALQSPWFIPHLIVYMAGYAILAMATLMAAR